MTTTIDISPEMKEKLDTKVAKRRLTPEEHARTVVENSLLRTARADRSWSEIAGAAEYPLTGEDAQAWVTRTRREGDEHRERAFWRMGR